MKKLLSAVLAVLMAVGMSVSAFAATETLGNTNFTQYVNASGKSVSKSVDGKRGSDYRIYGIAYESEAKKVLSIMNSERAAEGVAKLTWEDDLYQAAIQRALEQYVKQSHTRPNGTEWHTVHKLANGENLAGGAIFDAEEVMTGWMNSPGHRTNILDPDYTSVAVACVETDIGVFWVQLFHSDKKVSADNPEAKTTTTTKPTTAAEETSASSGKTVAAKDITSKLSSSSKATIKNAETITPAVMKEVANATSGKTVSVVFTTSFDGKKITQGQITVNPAACTGMEKNLDLGVYVEGKDVEKVAASFDKWYKNDVAVIQLAQSGALPATARVAAKPADLKGLDTDSLLFYTYNPSTKKVKLLENTNYKVDKSGFVHFDTNRGDYIIVTDAKLAK